MIKFSNMPATKPKILVSLTTITPLGHLAKLKEAEKLKIKELAFFPTCLNFSQRRQFYRRLEDSPIKSIPFAHLRDDMKPEELDYLTEKFHTQVFNIHPSASNPLEYDLSKYANRIFVENHTAALDENEIKRYAGICIDFSHLESNRLLKSAVFSQDWQLMQKYPCGCAHISAIKSRKSYAAVSKRFYYDAHQLEDAAEFNYLRRYLKNFPAVVAIELENSLAEQCQVKKMIESWLE